MKTNKDNMNKVFSPQCLEKTANLKFYCDDLDVRLSIKEYLKELLKTCWIEEDNFSGKRPFGNSGWQHDIWKVLIENNIVKGSLDSYGDVDEVDDNKVNTIILQIIDSL